MNTSLLMGLATFFEMTRKRHLKEGHILVPSDCHKNDITSLNLEVLLAVSTHSHSLCKTTTNLTLLSP